MRIPLYLLLFMALLLGQGEAQFLPPALWTGIEESSVVPLGLPYDFPVVHETYTLNFEAMKSLLRSAPLERTRAARTSPLLLSVPTPDRGFAKFAVVESPVMEPALAAQFPDMQTFAGQGVDDRTATIRLDVTPAGFHAMVRSLDGEYFIDPHNRGDVHHYVVYSKKNAFPYAPHKQDFPCVDVPSAEIAAELRQLLANHLTTATGPQLRTYRLACAATGEYTAYHGGTVALGQAAIVTAINRVSGVYETEVAVRLVLVANNSSIVYTNAATDPYTNGSPSSLLTQNQTNLDAVIGTANYDIGHVFSTAGGGLASLGVVCRAGLKARGETGTSSPVGDPFYIDYVAHEIGHQFGANHTFNSTTSNCGGGNRNASTAYEPGSGSTIMAYAGICAADDLQPHSDAYFHTISFDEIVAYTNSGSGNGCASITNTGNSAPTVNAGTGGFTIPASTPFALTGSATDPDNDALTYCWEEFDLGPAGSPNSPSGNAPIFRSFTATTNPTRTFPKLSDLLGNTQTIGEILPSYTRSLVFRLTARDNRIGGGGVNYSSITFNVSNTGSAFSVTSPNTLVNWPALSQQTVTWNVAGTSSAPINCANVKISLSTDGGNTFPTTLLASTPNDGSETVTIPNTQTATARMKVEAVGNVFFDISNVNFAIASPLPVQLASFTGRSVGSSRVVLEWMTISEVNNYGFEVERSAAQAGEFRMIPGSFVPGHGTTLEPHRYSFTDTAASAATPWYRLKQIDLDGSLHYTDPINVRGTTSAPTSAEPATYSLEQNYPNPFNPVTTISFSLPHEGRVSLKVYDALGRAVATIVDEPRSAGRYTTTFDGSGLASGVYLCRLQTADFVATRKFVLLR